MGLQAHPYSQKMRKDEPVLKSDLVYESAQYHSDIPNFAMRCFMPKIAREEIILWLREYK